MTVLSSVSGSGTIAKVGHCRECVVGALSGGERICFSVSGSETAAKVGHCHELVPTVWLQHLRDNISLSSQDEARVHIC